MRKALIGLIVAATALTPVAAQAQRGHRGGDNESRSEERAERIQQRNEARQQRQEQRQAEPQQQPQQQQQQVVQTNRGGDGGNRNWRGNDGNRGGDGGNRNWRGDDGNRAGNDGTRAGNDSGRTWRGGGGQGDGTRTRERPPSIYPQAWQGDPNDPRLRRYQQRERENWDRGENRRDDRNWRDNDRRGDRNWRDGDRRRWDRSWRNDRRYDWSNWRTRNRSIFRIGPYYSPYRGWGYNRFSIGIFLEPLFYSNRYWIGDPWQYRLPPAYPGTQWVRYYNDVLLVDIYTGEVIDVIYDFFW